MYDEDVEHIKELKKSIKASKEKEARIIEQIQTIINTNAKYKNDYENIISIMGIGQIGVIALLHLFLKYPEANQRQITSLTGLNPVYRQSGSSIQSQYRISLRVVQRYIEVLFLWQR